MIRPRRTIDVSDPVALARGLLDPKSSYSSHKRVAAVARAYLDLIEERESNWR